MTVGFGVDGGSWRYRVRALNARIRSTPAEHHSNPNKDEAVESPTTAIITRFDSEVLYQYLRTTYATCIYLEA